MWKKEHVSEAEEDLLVQLLMIVWILSLVQEAEVERVVEEVACVQEEQGQELKMNLHLKKRLFVVQFIWERSAKRLLLQLQLLLLKLLLLKINKCLHKEA